MEPLPEAVKVIGQISDEDILEAIFLPIVTILVTNYMHDDVDLIIVVVSLPVTHKVFVRIALNSVLSVRVVGVEPVAVAIVIVLNLRKQS